ncbi:hypothetical protein ADK41_20790 [Streptomyces caelestis]|uniref:Uncharacterized protein n=1 Tax=Streptomyces caelestis TaxID=36816 RepID=A0A0M9X864_9ACTN|nr:hypothetical protein ADK41_20790 [Streptomyces caelestis]KOV35504.1 hypothetical protein ADK58_03105 [Streptomyces sp. XY152]
MSDSFISEKTTTAYSRSSSSRSFRVTWAAHAADGGSRSFARWHCLATLLYLGSTDLDGVVKDSLRS